MELNFWPFNKKNKTKEYIIVKNVPLQQIECRVLKEEIARRKKENYECRIREANIKADHVDKLIDELCKEIRKDIKSKTSKTYKEKLASRITINSIKNIDMYGDRYRREYSEDYKERAWYEYVLHMLNDIDQDAIHIIDIFEYMKSDYRKILLENIKEEC